MKLLGGGLTARTTMTTSLWSVDRSRSHAQAASSLHIAAIVLAAATGTTSMLAIGLIAPAAIPASIAILCIYVTVAVALVRPMDPATLLAGAITTLPHGMIQIYVTTPGINVRTVLLHTTSDTMSVGTGMRTSESVWHHPPNLHHSGWRQY
jgi:hypothetical protein